MEKEIKFTEKEAQVLLQLIDIAVKAAGLQMAGNAIVLANKIQGAFAVNDVKKEEKK